MRLWDLFTAAVWAVAKFTFGAGLMATLLGLLATLDPVSAVLWMTVITVIAFFVLRPGREFKKLLPGLDPDRHYLREGIQKLASAAFKIAGAAATGGASGAAAGAAAAAAQDNDAHEQPSSPAGAASEPRPGREWVGDLTPPAAPAVERPGLPAPHWAQIPGTHRHVALDPAPETQQAEARGPRHWDGVLDTSTVRLALPPGPTTHARGLEDEPQRAAAVTTQEAGHGPASATNPEPSTPVPRESSSPAPGPTAVPAPPAVVREVITVTQGPEGANPAGGPVLHGEVVAPPSDHSVYRRPGTPVQTGDPRDVVDAEVVDLVDLSAGRDRGSDQPSTELVLYRSGRN